MTDLAVRTTPSRIGRAVAGITVALCTAVILAFAGLIPLGPWADEFYVVAQIKSHGAQFSFDRVWNWSPRPFSEFLVYIYGLAVSDWGRPLVTPALSPMWLLLWGTLLLPPLFSHRALVPSLVLGCLLLLGHNVSEVFYWPLAAFAYLPTLAAVVFVLVLDWVDMAEQSWARSAVIAALIIAATSSEVGAMFCVVYCVLVGLVAWREGDRAGYGFLLPLIIGGAVLAWLGRGRASFAAEVFGDPAIAHHPWIALRYAVQGFALQVVGSDAHDLSAADLALNFGSKALFFAGIYLCVPLTPRGSSRFRQAMRLALAAASLAAALLTLAAAYNQFGVDCCLRHGTMRQGYILVAIAALATALAAWKPPSGLGVAGQTMLLGAVILPLTTTLPRLTSDYRNYARFVDARTALWRSGTQGGQAFVVPQNQPGQIVGGYTAPPDLYRASEKNPLYAQWVLDFFGKPEGRFEPIRTP